MAESFWERNRGFLFPAGGCCGCLLLMLGFVFVFGFGGIGAILTGLRSSEPFQEAMDRARDSSEVAAALGTPIEAGLLFQGNISLNGTEGTASFGVPISGPSGEGRVLVDGRKVQGQWLYQRLEVRLDSGDVIDLRTERELEEAGVASGQLQPNVL